MSKSKMDEYIEEGIYGKKETKPDERRRFLGTLRERVILVLTKGQVMKKKGMDQLEAAMKDYPDAEILLNGKVRSSYFNPYKKLAGKYNIAYKSVTNKQAKTDLGLILAVDYAIEKEDISVEEEQQANQEQEDKPNRLAAFFKYLFTGSKK
ncbi:YueI family protein [Salinibacillus aidingensis]|uniref:YueI family protein n=1 Tax=Salinibacillus aidingensis TaxID=237684 RepID=A0ABP3LL25_9BACI